MKVELRYCSKWNYEPQAVSLTAKLLEHFKMQILEMKLIPSSGGCFELTANGKLLYSKLSEGKFPNEELLLKQLEALMAEVK